MKRWFAAVTLLLSLAVSAGCGGGATSAPQATGSGTDKAPAKSGEEKIHLVFLGYAAPVHDLYFKSVIEPFMKANPNIVIDYQDSENSAKMPRSAAGAEG